MKMSKGDELAHPTTQPRLVTEQIELMLAHIFRLPDVFNLAKQYLKPELFNSAIEPHYYALWKVALDVVKGGGTTLALFESPEYAYNLLETEILAAIQAEPTLVNQEYQERLFSRDPGAPGLLYWLYELTKPVGLRFATGRDLLKAFRLEREIQDPLRKALGKGGDKVLTNLPEFLQELQKRQVAIDVGYDDPVESGAPEGYFPKPLCKFSTGITWLDPFLNGGHAGKEVYGVLGAYGSGKTCMATSLMAKGALLELTKRKENPDYIPNIWYLFSYEATYDEIIVRLWAQECTIQHSRLEEVGLKGLTSIVNGYDSLMQYEKEFFNTKLKTLPNSQPQGERERLEEFRPLFNENLGILDMTGSGKRPNLGNGYVPEVAGIIAQNLRNRKEKTGIDYKVGGVVLDYAGLACRRHLNSKGMAHDELRHLLGEMPFEIKRQIAVPYDCPVWLFHQLAGAANKRTHATKQHYSDAAEATNFAENCAFAFALGTKDPQFGALQFTNSKARRASGLGETPLLCMEGEFYRLVQATRLAMGPDGKICRREELNTVASSSASVLNGTYKDSGELNYDPKTFFKGGQSGAFN